MSGINLFVHVWSLFALTVLSLTFKTVKVQNVHVSTVRASYSSAKHVFTQLLLKLNLFFFPPDFALESMVSARINLVQRDPHRCLKSRGAPRPPTSPATRCNPFCPCTPWPCSVPVVGTEAAELWIQDGKCDQDGGVWPREPNGGWHERKRTPAALPDLWLIEFYRELVGNSPQLAPSKQQLKQIAQEITSRQGFSVLTYMGW